MNGRQFRGPDILRLVPVFTLTTDHLACRFRARETGTTMSTRGDLLTFPGLEVE